MIEITKEERKQILLSMMKELDSFCKGHKLTYYLAFGTLLGAIRHKGFIPWDDDVDVMMPRKDYEQLVKLYPSSGQYRFLTLHNTDNYPYAFGKIIDTRTIKLEPIRKKYQVIGLDIDVFPIDSYPDDAAESKKWCDEIKKQQDSMHRLIEKYGKGRNIQRTIARNIIIGFSHILDDFGIKPVKKQVLRINKLSQKYNEMDTNFCGIASLAIYGEKKRNRKVIYENSTEVEFEGELFLAPEGYDEYLTDVYGDYMQLPPVEKRISHHSNNVYWI